jgi:hypothetical protein
MWYDTVCMCVPSCMQLQVRCTYQVLIMYAAGVCWQSRVDMYCLQEGMSTIMEGSATEWILGSWRSRRFIISGGQKGNERIFPTVSFFRKVASLNCNTNRSLF